MIGKGNGNPLQYSCLENPMDRGAWQAMVHRVAESWTQLKWPSTHAQKMIQTSLVTKRKESQRLRVWTYGCLDFPYLKWITNKDLLYIAHGTLLSVIWRPGWEGNLKANVYMCIYGWVSLLFTWNYHNAVNQLCAVLCLGTQSCPALHDPMDCILPGSSLHGDSPGRNTGVGCHALLRRIFLI